VGVLLKDELLEDELLEDEPTEDEPTEDEQLPHTPSTTSRVSRPSSVRQARTMT
jgi:hypothetical protein